MHSIEFTALARSADEMGRVVVAFVEVPLTDVQPWVAEKILPVAVMLENPDYTRQNEPSFTVTTAYIRRDAEDIAYVAGVVDPNDIRLTWDSKETARLPRREALAEFTVKAIHAMH